MAKNSKAEIEFHSNAWERFERAAGVVAKAPPQHRVKAAAKNKKMRREKKLKDKT